MAATRVHRVSARTRVNACAVIGLVAGGVAGLFVPWQLSVLIGWLALSCTLLGWIWAEIGGCDAAATKQLSTAEDASHSTAVIVMVTASVVSLGGVAMGLAKSRHVSFPLEVALTVVCVLAVLSAWFVVHTMFTLRYAHAYYLEPAGGIEFPGGTQPAYHDFAYFALTIGMSFATSDSEITLSRIRQIALRHALVSYLFGTVIVGLTINVMASFIG